MFFGIFTNSGLRQLRQSIAKKNTDSDTWRVRYQVAVSDIAFFKNQQWKVTNYALLIDAALVGISFKLALNTGLERLLLLTSAWLINLLASWVLLKLENAIQRARCRLKQALDKLMIQDKKPPRNEMYLVLEVLLVVLF
jgi:hypothetical protein